MKYSKKILALISAITVYGFFIVAQKTYAETTSPNPLSITYMRTQIYLGSELKIEQTLEPDAHYNQYIASYISDNLKIYGLLTVPIGTKPAHSWPVIIFNHGYVTPKDYETTKRYELYVHAFASNGYIVFKPDYRGNGKSEGTPNSQYFAPDYTIDALNAIATLKKYSDANPDKIGMWGHSDGGNVILRSIVVNTHDIKAADIWGGVVAPYSQLTTDWQQLVPYQQPKEDRDLENNNMTNLIAQNGIPKSNPVFWNSIDPTHYLSDITTPIELDTGGADEQVPPIFSYNLTKSLRALGKPVTYFYYPHKNHNISFPILPAYMHIAIPYAPAIQHSLEFFNTYLK